MDLFNIEITFLYITIIIGGGIAITIPILLFQKPLKKITSWALSKYIKEPSRKLLKKSIEKPIQIVLPHLNTRLENERFRLYRDIRSNLTKELDLYIQHLTVAPITGESRTTCVLSGRYEMLNELPPITYDIFTGEKFRELYGY